VANPAVIFTEKYGSLSATGMALETTYGTPVAATNFVPSASNSFTSDPGLFFPDLMQALRDKQIYPLYGEEKDLGAISGPMFPTNGIPVLVAALGAQSAASTAGTTPTTYYHGISQANSLPSLTVEKNIGNFQSLQFGGCRVGKYQIKGAAGNTAAEFSADLVGQSVAILSTPTTVNVLNELPFQFAEFTLTQGTNSLKQAANFQIDIENGLKETYTFNQSHSLQFLTPTSLKVSGSFEVVFDALNTSGGQTFDNFFQQAQSGTTTGLTFTMQHPNTGTSALSYGTISIGMPSVNLSKTDQKISAGSVVMETINFEAYYNLGTATFTGTVATGSPTITGITAGVTANLVPGMKVTSSGTGVIPANSYIVSVGATSITINANGTTSGSATITPAPCTVAAVVQNGLNALFT
jgi:hypothetical protein